MKVNSIPIMGPVEILEHSDALDYNFPGLYFLLQHDEVVYVGQSRTTILSRLAHHLKDKKFNRVAVQHLALHCDYDLIEAEYIWSLQPKYNQAMPPNPHYMKRELLKSILHIGGRRLNKVIKTHDIESRLGGYYDIREIGSHIKGYEQ